MASNIMAFGEWPSASLFTFPPASDPMPIPPAPPGSWASAPPFEIPDHIFSGALDPKVPITIACLYAVTVKGLNIYNTSRNRKPWAISKTKPFFVFVVLHNVFLAVYSAWTFWGMLGAMKRSVVNPMGPNGLAGLADSMCQLNGGAGLSAATIFDEPLGKWTSFSGASALSSDGLPNRTTPGRIWNEGLAFYGWLFYISKFYEVLDTFIILAKGKLSSTLQTYHHAGAMMCMWAGMRYMSCPIWMFVFFNSFIHAMMYTYYTLTAFNIRVPQLIKRTLTSLQITQFLIGASYAMVHSFISYTVPVTVAVEKAAGAAITSSATVPTATGALESLKKLAFGAAAKASAAAAGVSPPAVAKPEVTYKTVYVTQACITTSGETFAIWLNVLYLAPLTYLFVMFFIRSYLRRSNAEAVKLKGKIARRESNVTLAEKAGWDAARDTTREVYGEADENAIGDDVVDASERRRQTRSNGRANGKVNGHTNGAVKH